MGGNASAPEIGEALDIPARTIRYRLSVLMERGVLLPSFYLTHERKVGLGERILVVQECAGKGDVLERIMREMPVFYWHIPSHGKHDGYLIHSVYDVREPEKLDRIVKKLKERRIIESHYSFDITDYETKRVDFSKYRPDGTWVWDWKKWSDDIPEKLQKVVEVPHKMKEVTEIISCDDNDIRILKQLKESSDSSMSSLSAITGIPIGSVRDKVQRLREGHVIKDFRRAYGFVGNLLWFSCFFKVKKNLGAILGVFYELPHPATVLMESKNSYCFRYGLTTSDLKGFLEGFRALRSDLESYSFQFHLPDEVESSYGEVFDLYNAESGRWEIPLEKCLEIIERHS